MTTEAGWYPDPEDATQLRYWDGATWTEHRHPVDGGVTDGAAEATADEAVTGATVPDEAADAPAGQADGDGGTETADIESDEVDDGLSAPTTVVPGLHRDQSPTEIEPAGPGDAVGEGDPTVPVAPVPVAPVPGPTDHPGETDVTVPRPIWEPPPPAPAPPSGSESKSKKKPVLIGLILLIVAALIGGGLFWLLSDDSATYTWGGVTIADPMSTIDAADAAFAADVADRGGVTVDDSRCYFAQSTDADAEHPRDVGDEVLCGPVLFIDDDPADGVFIGFPLDGRENDDGDVELRVGDEPSSPRPGPIGDHEKLTRPDGAQPPDDDGGIEAPDVPEANAGLILIGDELLDDLDLEDASTLVVGRSRAVELTGLATPTRIGTHENTRRAASGEQFIAFEVIVEPGDPYFGSPRQQLSRFDESNATIELDVDGETAELDIPHDRGDDGDDDDGNGGGDAFLPIRAVVSVPEDADEVDLVLTDSGVEQRISLLTGEPGAENLAVLTRQNRDVEINETVTIPGVITFPDGESVNEDFSITVVGVGLLYYVTDAPDQQPTSPSNAFLVVQHFITTSEITEEDGIALEPGHLRLNTDTFEYGPVNLAAGDGQVLIAFEVPADFTTGTLTIHGEAPSGDLVVQLPEPAQVDIEIAAG